MSHFIKLTTDGEPTGDREIKLPDDDGVVALTKNIPAAGAPSDAKFIVQESSSGLSAEQSLGALATGIVKNTTAAGVGVLSIAIGADLPTHTHDYAPSGAKYIVQEATGDLSAEQALGGLATGIVKNTTTGGVGVLSIASSGVDYQAADAELTALAGLSSAADKLPYFTGSGSAALADFTSAGRALVDDATAAAQCLTLGAPRVVATADTVRTSSSGYVTLLAAAPVGRYRINYYFNVTSAGASGDTFYVRCRWWDGASKYPQLRTLRSVYDNLASGSSDPAEQFCDSVFQDCHIFYFYHSDASKNIDYAFTYAVKSGSPSTNLKIALEYLGA